MELGPELLSASTSSQWKLRTQQWAKPVWSIFEPTIGCTAAMSVTMPRCWGPDGAAGGGGAVVGGGSVVGVVSAVVVD